MGKMKFVMIVVLAMLIQGCASTYYQLYEVDSDVAKTNEALVYSDEHCDIIYNLWDESGSMDFVFTNKTDKDIYIDLTHSFFIQNGMAYDYYSDKEYTSTRTISESSTASLMASYTKYGYTHTPYLWTPTSISRGAKVASMLMTGHSTSITTKTDKYIFVPAKASKVVRSFSISSYIYMVCDNDNFNWPRKESEAFIYDKDNSPLRFRNRIAYMLEGQSYTVDNSFWLVSVKNYKKNQMLIKREEKDCITKMRKFKWYFKFQEAGRFYNTYMSGQKLLW